MYVKTNIGHENKLSLVLKTLQAVTFSKKPTCLLDILGAFLFCYERERRGVVKISLYKIIINNGGNGFQKYLTK